MTKKMKNELLDELERCQRQQVRYSQSAKRGSDVWSEYWHGRYDGLRRVLDRLKIKNDGPCRLPTRINKGCQ